MDTHSSLLTQTGKGQSALVKQKPEVAGEQYLYTPLATFAHRVLSVRAAIKLFYATLKR